MKSWLKRIAIVVAAVLSLIAVILFIELASGQAMGIFSGTRPKDLGFRDGQFKACSWKPNCVSSTADRNDATHYIAPLKLTDDVGADWRKLRAHVANIRNAAVVLEHPGYIQVEFKSEKLGFVDDVEFAIDHKTNVIQVRSASRLGVRDFGVNRTRVEDIRAVLAKP
jgi:uncharacterized protein (DUF1499 family)